MTPEQVADAILGTSGGLTREELLLLCQRQHDDIPRSLAIRRQRLEHAAALATKEGDWQTLAAVDARLHSLDEFVHRLFGPVMDGLGTTDITPKVTRIERVIIDYDAMDEREAAPSPGLRPEPQPESPEPRPPPLPPHAGKEPLRLSYTPSNVSTLWGRQSSGG